MQDFKEILNVPDIPVNGALTMLLVSIALEEIGLSHIIHAEAEKIQAAVQAVICDKAEVEDLLDIDESVNLLLRTIVKKELLLELKMVEVLEALKKVPTPCQKTCRTQE